MTQSVHLRISQEFETVRSEDQIWIFWDIVNPPLVWGPGQNQKRFDYSTSRAGF